jgi:hypothetical protein
MNVMTQHLLPPPPPPPPPLKLMLMAAAAAVALLQGYAGGWDVGTVARCTEQGLKRHQTPIWW